MMENLLKDGSGLKTRILTRWFPALEGPQVDNIRVYIVYTYLNLMRNGAAAVSAILRPDFRAVGAPPALRGLQMDVAGPVDLVALPKYAMIVVSRQEG